MADMSSRSRFKASAVVDLSSRSRFKVHEEVDAVVSASLPTLSHRSQLHYVNACLLETMRIRTLVPIATHATAKDVMVNLHSLHMDPAYWTDPDWFDLGRFLDAEGNVINKPQSFMPFGGGRRVCLGELVARMELFLFLSTLLQSFTFRTPEGAPPPNTDGIIRLTVKPHLFQLCAIRR
ncbi:cytochrome P450 2U1-like [Branchiostoma floridae]|uniref:Cytochrome P450 2U1-like n=1 Tax=Branchiostoma floridae TaxID=7739 RepID=A0A9J7HUM2_BRAFL|nr:cytochrome P450 2U1-like [Branchiostoma floridae]